jgi:hypothetical protein
MNLILNRWDTINSYRWGANLEFMGGEHRDLVIIEEIWMPVFGSALIFGYFSPSVSPSL